MLSSKIDKQNKGLVVVDIAAVGTILKVAQPTPWRLSNTSNLVTLDT